MSEGMGTSWQRDGGMWVDPAQVPTELHTPATQPGQSPGAWTWEEHDHSQFVPCVKTCPAWATVQEAKRRELAARFRQAAQTEEIRVIDDPGPIEIIPLRPKGGPSGRGRRPVAWVVADWLYAATLAGALLVMVLVAYGLWQWDFS